MVHEIAYCGTAKSFRLLYIRICLWDQVRLLVSNYVVLSNMFVFDDVSQLRYFCRNLRDPWCWRERSWAQHHNSACIEEKHYVAIRLRVREHQMIILCWRRVSYYVYKSYNETIHSGLKEKYCLHPDFEDFLPLLTYWTQTTRRRTGWEGKPLKLGGR